ncbi:LLM class flavin-dependent oxidoreductase [Actinomadura algeriensis]|uniref:Alkanesulfonate monooxygenase SsuD/methylene tetrahydromethanopterin reductase-like flavin-dependent oxidoreductase (Luciferase family) n=1 Tax=Actinomadura algeriensis TaxID=1679523 RepID=A0ABR9K2D6_9ACTN|nr:LLM class flavin-dependent oxidoreductase [Actinomadura algeriensis]MBE1536878.1 alkanesulfonate monooxygenase SsuD/methylene tetrahydromethanopterin reductase-like flavin-dependent oxidoreductase (luciferase family) [Actinomadura algeriensis]
MDLATPVFHLFLPQMRMSVDAIVERALAAEDAGFEGIAFMDHLVPPLADEHDMWDAMTIVGWVLARTSTLGVGHLVLCDAFRHPAVLARQVASLDHASGGRFELGIGWGSAPEEFETFGIGSTAPRERVARLAESLQIMRALWAGDVVDHHGEHFTLTGARQRPLPTRQIPITIGGAGRRTLELVRAHADWWNVPVHQIGRMKRLREQTGGARVSMQTMVALVPGEAERADVVAAARRRFGRTAMGDGLLIGTAPELAAHFSRLHAEGVDRFYVWFTDFAPVETLHRFSEVISSDLIASRPAR